MQNRKFLGLYTNADQSDLPEGYFPDCYNIRFRGSYVEGQYFKIGQSSTPSVTGNIVWMDSVIISDDRYATKLVDGKIQPERLSGNYQIRILITREELENSFKYRVYYFQNNQWIEPFKFGNYFQSGQYETTVEHDYSKTDAPVYIRNKDGIVKIFLPHDSWWFGKIKRVWKSDDLFSFDGFYLDRLSEPYNPTHYHNYWNDDPANNTDYFITQQDVRADLEVRFYNLITTGFIGSFDFTFINKQDKIHSAYYWPGPNHSLSFKTVDVQCLTADGTLIDNPYHARGDDEYGYVDPGDHFWFFKLDDGNLAIDYIQLLSLSGQQVLIPPDGYSYIEAETITIELQDGTFFDLNGAFYKFSPDWLILNGWTTISGKNVIDVGLEQIDDNLEIVGTVILDNGEEHIGSYKKLDVSQVGGKFGVQLQSVRIPRNVNKRISAIAFYYKFEKELDFEQFAFFNLLSEQSKSHRNIYLDSLAPTGVYLSQTIGIVFNYDSFETIYRFDDYQEINGISFGLKGSVYYPAIGNGSVQNNIFYPDRVIRGIGLSQIIRMSNIRESLGIHGTSEMKQIYVQDSGNGEFVFQVKDRIGYGIRKYHDIYEAPDGIIILTKRGIFITDGGQEVLLSEQINDVIEKNYANGNVYFDNSEKKVYFFITDLSQLYVYSFQDKAWTIILTQGLEGSPNQIYTDEQGVTWIRKGNSLYQFEVNNYGVAYMKFPESDFGSISTLKTLKAVVFDFIGTIKFQDKFYTNDVRKKIVCHINLDNRVISSRLGIEYYLADDCKLYGFDLDIDIVSREI